jgi:hypothetical protein
MSWKTALFDADISTNISRIGVRDFPETASELQSPPE